MTCARFYMCFIFLLILPWTNGSLLSRFRYPNEYISSSESMVSPEDFPPDLYEKVIEERTDLIPILGPIRKTKLRHPQLPYLRRSTIPVTESESDSEYEYRNEGIPTQEYDDEDNIMNSTVPYTYEPDYENTTMSSLVSNSSRMMPFLTLQQNNDTRKFFFPSLDSLHPVHKYFTGYIKARCYQCNKFYNEGIPKKSLCYKAFDSQDWRAITHRRTFRTLCYYYDTNDVIYRIEKANYKRWEYTNDNGLKRAYASRWVGGCYKRFLDIGEVYTSRGCRRDWPHGDKHIITHRMTRLEVLLTGVKEGCISSPHASLTPFARGISLYVRYHVCVCEGRYCNKATANKTTMFILFVAVLSIVL